MVKKFRLQILAAAKVMHMMDLSFSNLEEAEAFVREAIANGTYLEWDEYVDPEADPEFHIKEIE
jgi:hypothetical protein